MAGLGVKYEVRHNPATGRWNVLRGGKPTGAFGRDQHTAIGAATRDASLEARESDLQVTVWLKDGKRARRVWPM